MPLPKNLEDLLKHMAPEAAAEQRKLWEANPVIAEQVDKYTVPQDVFNRELNKAQTEAKTAKEDREKIVAWEKKNRPEFDRAVADAERYRKEAEELRLKVEKAATRQEDLTGTEVDADKLMQNVLAKLDGRTVSQEKLNELIAAEATKISTSVDNKLGEERQKFFKETVPAIAQWTNRMARAVIKYQQEFGKELNDEEFGKFMAENNITDPTEAYQRFTEPTRRQKEVDAEVEKRVQAELAKRTLPGTSSTEYTGEKGFLQLKIEGEKGPVVYPEGSELGDRSAANMAAKELRESGVF